LINSPLSLREYKNSLFGEFECDNDGVCRIGFEVPFYLMNQELRIKKYDYDYFKKKKNYKVNYQNQKPLIVPSINFINSSVFPILSLRI